jgi:hypothetical protein
LHVIDILNFPRIVFCLSFVTLWASEWLGAWLRRRRTMDEDQRGDFNLIAGATLTLLGLIVGFSFSMSISRYDHRKSLEATEANAIGTEYVRADLLPGTDGAKVRELLGKYLDERVLFYVTRDDGELRQVNARTAQLQADLWTAVRPPVLPQPTSVTALTVAGMNDVLNSQGYTQAAWWNRIPDGAWVLMTAIAICANMLIGYGIRSRETRAMFLLVLPLVVSISFFLIADIDSARGGMIRVRPLNLESLSHSIGRP